jgi:hypothetical protein
MTNLSVNLNKIALLRNARNVGIPRVTQAAKICVEAGAQGITVHPRPDHRHILTSDVYELAEFLSGYPDIELNIEGNPFPELMEIVRQVRPTQCTLVPEVAILNVKPGQAEEFEQAFSSAQKLISSMRGYISHELQRCIEVENKYLLLVRWQRIEDHTEGFRKSALI